MNQNQPVFALSP